jgi:hypothetical protein
MIAAMVSAAVPRENAPASRGHLVEDRSEGELVGAEVDRVAARLLRRHVPDRAQHDAGPRRLDRGGQLGGARVVPRDELREAEVEDLDPVPKHHHVLRLQVPMHDARLVRARERVGHLARLREQPAQGSRAFGELLAKRPALHELHDHVGSVSLPADLVDRHDVGMVQGRGGPRLLLETREPFAIGRELGGQDLDRHLASETRVACPVDLAHAAGAQRGEHLVGAEARSRGECHFFTAFITRPSASCGSSSGLS